LVFELTLAGWLIAKGLQVPRTELRSATAYDAAR